MNKSRFYIDRQKPIFCPGQRVHKEISHVIRLFDTFSFARVPHENCSIVRHGGRSNPVFVQNPISFHEVFDKIPRGAVPERARDPFNLYGFVVNF